MTFAVVFVHAILGSLDRLFDEMEDSFNQMTGLAKYIVVKHT